MHQRSAMFCPHRGSVWIGFGESFLYAHVEDLSSAGEIVVNWLQILTHVTLLPKVEKGKPLYYNDKRQACPPSKSGTMVALAEKQ